MSFSDFFEELSLRFFYNLPLSEYESFERIFIHLQLAHWFYLDHCVGTQGLLEVQEHKLNVEKELEEKKNHDSLLSKLFPNMTERSEKRKNKGKEVKENRLMDTPAPYMTLKEFCLEFFVRIEQLKPFKSQFDEYFENFQDYLHSIPVCGGVLINTELNKILLVRGKKGSWSFPKGKMNENESRMNCAVREVYEETGYLMNCKEQEFITRQVDSRLTTLFIDANVPESTFFKTQTVNV